MCNGRIRVRSLGRHRCLRHRASQGTESASHIFSHYLEYTFSGMGRLRNIGWCCGIWSEEGARRSNRVTGVPCVAWVWSYLGWDSGGWSDGIWAGVAWCERRWADVAVRRCEEGSRINCEAQRPMACVILAEGAEAYEDDPARSVYVSTDGIAGARWGVWDWTLC